MKNKNENDVVNLGSGQRFKIKEIVDTIAKNTMVKKLSGWDDRKNKDNIRLMDTTLKVMVLNQQKI